jgi:hypothetical protein
MAFRGLTKKYQGHIHNYVYKPMGLSAKRGREDLCVKGGILAGGSLQFCQDTRKGSRVTEKNTGLNAKSPHLIFYLWPANRGTSRLQIAGAPGGLRLG